MSKKQVLKYFRAIAKDADIAMNIDSKIPIAELALELARRGRYVDYIRSHEGNYQYGGDAMVEGEPDCTAEKGNIITVKNGLATLDISMETDITITDQYLDTLFDEEEQGVDNDEGQRIDNDGELDNNIITNEPEDSLDNNLDLLDIDLSTLFDNDFLGQDNSVKPFEEADKSLETEESETIVEGHSLILDTDDRNANIVDNNVMEPGGDSVVFEPISSEVTNLVGEESIDNTMLYSDGINEDFDNNYSDIENTNVVNSSVQENQNDINTMDFDYSENSQCLDNNDEEGNETAFGLDMYFDSYDYDDGEDTALFGENIERDKGVDVISDTADGREPNEVNEMFGVENEENGDIEVDTDFEDSDGEVIKPVENFEENEDIVFEGAEDTEAEDSEDSGDSEDSEGEVIKPVENFEENEAWDLEIEGEPLEDVEENGENIESVCAVSENEDVTDRVIEGNVSGNVVQRNYDLDALSDFVSTDVNVDSEFETAERSMLVDNMNDGLDNTRRVHRRKTNSDISGATVLLNSVNQDSAFNEVENNFDATDNIMDMSDSVNDNEDNAVTIDNGSLEAEGNESAYVSRRRRHIPRARESDFMSFGLSEGNSNSSYCNFGIDEDIDVDNNGLSNFSISDTHADTFSDLSPAAQMLCGFDVNVVATTEIIPTMDLVQAVMKVAETFNNVGKTIVGGVKKVFGALTGGRRSNIGDSENEGNIAGISEETVENAVDMSFLDNEPVYYNNEEILQQGSVNTLNDLYDIFGYSSTNDSELGINGQSAADGEENGYNTPSNDDNNAVIERDIDYDNDTSDIDDEGVEEPEFDNDFGDTDDIIDDGIGGLLSAEIDDEISSDGIRFDDF